MEESGDGGRSGNSLSLSSGSWSVMSKYSLRGRMSARVFHREGSSEDVDSYWNFSASVTGLTEWTEHRKS